MLMKWKPITEADFDQALGALPPRCHFHDAFLLGEPHDVRPCTVALAIRETFRPFAKIDDSFYSGEPVTVAEFHTARADGFKVLRKFRVTLEASAAIGIEIEVDAEDADAAEKLGETWLKANRDACAELVTNLIDVSPHATAGYAQATGLSITSVTVSAPDDEGFEVVDAFEPDDFTN